MLMVESHPSSWMEAANFARLLAGQMLLITKHNTTPTCVTHTNAATTIAIDQI